MNILFYIDPIIEQAKPSFKEAWANSFSLDLIKTILGYDNDNRSNIYVILNEPLSNLFKGRDYVQKVVVVSQKELLEVFNWDSLGATIAWQTREYSKLQLDCYCNLYKNKLGSFIPDIVITFSNIPFFRELYPNALILHMEYGIFSRKPFPETWYLDINGMHGVSYLNENFNNIKNKIKLQSDKRENLCKLKKTLIQNIKKKSPFDQIINKYTTKFKYLVLLPLYPSNIYYFKALSNFESQYQLLIYMLESISDDIGVIVTTHPEYNFLNHDLVNYLRDKYNNFIYEYDFENFYAPSQYLISYVDAVITISTSLALQTLIWEKKLITFNKNFMSFASDACDITNLEDVLKRKNKEKDDILFWILTRYCVSKRYLYNPIWLNRFLTVSLEKFRNDEIKSGFYDLIDDEDKVIENLLKDCDWNIPNLSTNYSYDKLKQLYYTTKKDYDTFKQSIKEKFSSSSKMLEFIKDKEQILIEKINKNIIGDCIFVWGAGTHTKKLIGLMEKYSFDTCKIKGIIDSNMEKVVTEKNLNGIQLIYKEDFFANKLKVCSDIIISSASYEKDIYNELRYRVGTNVNIIRMYDNVDFKVLI